MIHFGQVAGPLHNYCQKQISRNFLKLIPSDLVGTWGEMKMNCLDWFLRLKLSSSLEMAFLFTAS